MRAYAVMEGEDPVAVLSDLELLLRLTDPGRPATALFCYAEPPGPQGTRRVTVASAGHPPPLLLGPARTEFADTALSAPLGMLACWEAPSTQVDVAKGETVLLYGDALLRRTGRARDAAFDLLRSAAAAAAPAVRDDPAALLAHLTEALAPPGSPAAADSDEAVLLAVRF
jgi:serine phosphatase RsbU (regulator of sigma subunit)